MKKILLAFMLVFMNISAASAGPSLAASCPNFAATTEVGAREAISCVLDTIRQSATELRDKSGLQGAGLYLVGGLMCLALLIVFIRNAMGSHPVMKSFAEAIPVLMLSYLATAFIQPVAGIDMKAKIESSINQAASNISGTSDATLYNAVGKSFEGIFNLWELGGNTQQQGNQAQSNAGSWWQRIIDIPSNAFATAIDWLGLFFFRLGVTFFLLLAVTICMAQYIVGLFLSSLAVALSPLFVPWVILPWTRFLFEGWLGFFLRACMFKLVCFYMIAVMATMFGVFPSLLAPRGENLSFNLIAYAMGILVAFIITFLMWQIPSIANGLISGVASANFGAVAFKTTAAAAKVVNSTARTSLSAVHSAAKGVGRGAQISRELGRRGADRARSSAGSSGGGRNYMRSSPNAQAQSSGNRAPKTGKS